ncbi:uncharacterized protein LOC124922159 [Impatiens glandulifera]|uniref:uncharacterized protein LOC124922159 n=1 Tax=Impatiens glandulifera TaxID=253017 RepID=UPI001FB17C73|nr:uncharacterized protein LOC124922159 [Impatiens glandulifera]
MMKSKKDQQLYYDKEKSVQAVLSLLRKQSPLSLKQEKFCSKACVDRFLKSKGFNVNKAVKHLRACLSWRDTISIDNLMADEFTAELAEGMAYVAGHDEESRPVLVFRIKQDYQKFHSQKMLTRLVVFTLEVAIQTMPRNVQEFVLLFDASFYRSASAFMNVFLSTVKMVAEYYPGRLHKAFIIDPPSLFSYLWKGVRPFLELSHVTSVVSSLDLEDPLDFNNNNDFFTDCPRSSSLRFDSSSQLQSTAKIGSCSSSRFTFTVSHHLDSLKPWYLSLADTSASKVGPATISPLNARSLSFASPVARTQGSIRKNFFPSTPMPQKNQRMDMDSGVNGKQARTPKPSFFQSPAVFFRRGESTHQVTTTSKGEKCRESFGPFLKFYRRPYDEMTYRSKMRPPLGGLISIVPNHHNSSQMKRRRHISLSQRF